MSNELNINTSMDRRNFLKSSCLMAVGVAIAGTAGSAGFAASAPAIADAATIPALPAAAKPKNGVVEMKTKLDATGTMRFDVKGGSLKVDAPMQIYTANHTKAQQFSICYADCYKGTYYYYIRCAISKLTLTSLGKTTEGSAVVQTFFTGSTAQQWSMHRPENGTYYFKNRNTGLIITVKGNSKANSTPIVQGAYKGSNAQKWAMYVVPNPGNLTKMSTEEYNLARGIFNSYNSFRASKGLPAVQWSDSCADMAYKCSTECAARGYLSHRLGIPAAAQNNHSDILQYSTWKMSANETVQRWSKSDGHRKMMQCNSALTAGVGCYNDDGTWFYTIVYDFVGANQNGK